MDRLLREYDDKPHVGRASDLLSAAIVHADFRARVTAIAGDLLQKSPKSSLLADLADHITSGDRDRMARAVDLEVVDSKWRIRRLKDILSREPRNAVRWVDLSREYIVLGEIPHANDAMRVAGLLAPQDRFVLRSTAALLAEQGRLERAVAILGASDAAHTDPWLLAPLIALSDLAGLKPHRIRDAMRMVEDGAFPPEHTADLAAALGTLEFSTGSDRRARQLFRASLIAPTENALAQAVWLSDETRADLLDDLPESVPRAYEATARQAAQELDWHVAVCAARNWLQDQPFSNQAAIFGSWSACEADEWASAVDFADAGLRVSPADAVLLNNLAYALASSGEWGGAVPVLARARRVTANSRERAVLAATEGLVLYKGGFVDLGRRRYEGAINAFLRQQQKDLAAKAAIVIARAELAAGASEAVEAIERMERLMNNVTDPAICHDAVRLQQTVRGPAVAPTAVAQRRADPDAVAPIATRGAYELDE